MVRKLKALLVIGIISSLLLIINACCDEGFSYKWHNIILQKYSNGELVSENTIKQNEFSLRVHLLSSKTSSGNYIPKLINNAYANDCMGEYLNIDEVTDIDIVLLTYENGSHGMDIMTYYFDAILDGNSGEKVAVFDLPGRLNQQDKEPIGYFDLVLNEYFENDVIGNFVVAVNLADERSLTDTTEVLKLKP